MRIACTKCGSAVDLRDAAAETVCPSCGETITSSETLPTRSYLSDEAPSQLASGDANDQTMAFPERIGSYRVNGFLGEGGFGRVYLGLDEELQRPVAIKVPLERDASAADVEAMVAEARIAAAFRHPGLVQVYSVGRDAELGFYIVMELVKGESLREILRRSPLPAPRAAELMADVADAVHFAHRELVHRDLKPANILLDEEGRPRVSDFGLAVYDEHQHRDPRRRAGTLAYMSPEQVRGDRLDGRTDIWSLGVILYEMLSGRRPFPGDRSAILEGIQKHEYKPLRQRDQSIPEALERIVNRCLEKRPSDRYSTASDLARDLREFVAETSNSQSQTFISSQPPATTSIRPVVFWGTMAGLLAAVGLLLGLVMNRENGSDQPLANPLVGLPERDAAPESDAPSPGSEALPPSLDEPDRLLWLLITEPRRLFGDPKDLRPRFDADQQLFTVTSDGAGLYTLGETNRDSYEIQVEMRKVPLAGSGGLFFGFPHEPENPNKIGFHVIQAYWFRDQKQGLTGYLRHQIKYLRTGETGTYISSGVGHDADIPQPFSSRAILRVEVKQNRIAHVYWNGINMTQELFEVSSDGIEDCKGTLGLYNSFGTTDFSRVTFTAFEDA